MKTALSIFKGTYSNGAMGLPILYLLFLGVFLGSVSPLYAQIEGVKNGDRIKLDAPTIDRHRLVGNVTELSPSTVVLATKDSTYVIPYSSIKKLAISTGKRNRTRWKLGFALGSISGAVVGSFFTEKPKCNSRSDGDFCLDFTGLENIGKVSTGLLIGALVGTGVGLAMKKDRWERVSVGLAALNQPVKNSDSYGLSPSVSFRIPLNR